MGGDFQKTWKKLTIKGLLYEKRAEQKSVFHKMCGCKNSLPKIFGCNCTHANQIPAYIKGVFKLLQFFMALNQFLADVMLKVSKTGSFVDLTQARRDNIL